MAFDSFLTNPGTNLYKQDVRCSPTYFHNVLRLKYLGAGGQIVDIIRYNKEGSNDTITIRGYVPSSDPYEANSTLVQVSSTACALQPSCTASLSTEVAPQGSIYPVDMSYCGSEGLLTDRCIILSL